MCAPVKLEYDSASGAGVMHLPKDAMRFPEHIIGLFKMLDPAVRQVEV
jgi:hypothetical protein